MEGRFIILLLLAICSIYGANAQYNLDIPFNCRTNVSAQPLQLIKLAGVWYEAARVPNMDVMDCLNVTVPLTASTELQLKLRYIDKTNQDRRAVNETIALPWNNDTKNSIFELTYPGTYNATITYKIVYTDYVFATVICGYASMSPVPLFKLLTRQRQLNPSVKAEIQARVDKTGLNRYLIWPEQAPDRCNAALRPTAGVATILALAVVCSLFKSREE